MSRVVSKPSEQAVFLNVPFFDDSYEPIFIAIITALVCLGRDPHCVLELSDDKGRLARIWELIGKCRVSVHDLSRVGTPARFNMPFELGLAYALKTCRPASQYEFIILENRPRTVKKVLSDLDAYDAVAYHGTPRGAINAVLDKLATPGPGSFSATPFPRQVYDLWKPFMEVIRAYKKDNHFKTVFSRTMFLYIVSSARYLAGSVEFIAEKRTDIGVDPV